MTIKHEGEYMNNELDLEKELRPKLEILGNEIIISLKKRLRYKQNLEIYSPGLVVDHPKLSLLEYELGRVEEIHAELGRYTYADQEAFTDVNAANLIIKRPAPPCPIFNFPTGLGPEIVRFYIQWAMDFCKPGADSDTYGETVTADAVSLLNIYERITLGKYVAEKKYQMNTEGFRAADGAPGIERLLVDSEREAQVIEKAAQLAGHHEFDAGQARHVFGWLIRMTLRVEVQYIIKRLRNARESV